MLANAKNEASQPRRIPGFGDFALAGNKCIEPGQPDYSLLYHAFAAPSVLVGRNNTVLDAFPTLAEIEALENYIYAVKRTSLAALRALFPTMAIVMFATQYRNAPMGVSGKHAQLCFARSGVGCIGNLPPRYDGSLRSFVGTSEGSATDFHVVPRRFSAYLAIETAPRAGQTQSLFGPQDRLDSDSGRKFWVPVHKLFGGIECLAGMELDVLLSRGMVNDELGSFHRFLKTQGLQSNWSGTHLEQFPFAIKDEKIASLSTDPQYGPGVLVPRPNTLFEEAYYQGARLTFPVDSKFPGNPINVQMSSLFILPGGVPPSSPQYLDDAEQWTARLAPEYINVRHRVVNGQIDNLNLRPDMMEIISRGNYNAQHYIDFSGDGWVAAACPALAKVANSGSTVSPDRMKPSLALFLA